MNKKEFKIKADKINNINENSVVKEYEKIIGITISRRVDDFLNAKLELNRIFMPLRFNLYNNSLNGNKFIYKEQDCIIPTYMRELEAKGFRVSDRVHIALNDKSCFIEIKWDFKEMGTE